MIDPDEFEKALEYLGHDFIRVYSEAAMAALKLADAFPDRADEFRERALFWNDEIDRRVERRLAGLRIAEQTLSKTTFVEYDPPTKRWWQR